MIALSALESSLAPVLLIVGLALLFLPGLSPNDDRIRFGVFGFCILLGWRYIAWRFAETVPPLALTPEAIASWVFLLLEAASLVGSSLAFLILSRRRERSTDADRHAGWWEAGSAPPWVDVLITTYNEEEPILARTIAGAVQIDYPRLRVWVLDDGRRPWLAELCRRKGVTHLTRPDNRHAKAGNINAALERLKALPEPPDFIVVLDADFVPHDNFVRRALALFHDPTVGLVQTPQHFFNPDPIQSNLSIGEAYPDEQRFFFDHLMASRDAWGIAFCCGTSSMMRWSGLMAIGGFPTDSVTEDFLVTMRLRAIGLKTVYLNERLSDGLAPEGLKEYITQRGRWCLGLMQIVRGPLGPFGRHDLGYMDRISLIDAMLYWATTYPFRFACLIVPLLYWLFGITVVNATVPGVISHFVPYYAAVLIALNWGAGGLILPLLQDVSQMLGMTEIIKAVVIGLARPTGHGFKVTAKGGARDRIIIQWGMLGRFALIGGLTLGGMLYSLLFDYAPAGRAGDGKVIVLFWSFYNLAALLLAMAVCIERPRYRRDERFETAERATLETATETMQVMLVNISAGGAFVRGPDDLEVGTLATLHLPGVGAVECRVVRAGGGLSLQFVAEDMVRDRLIRKLFSRRYSGGMGAVDLGRLMAGLASRLSR